LIRGWICCATTDVRLVLRLGAFDAVASGGDGAFADGFGGAAASDSRFIMAIGFVER